MVGSLKHSLILACGSSWLAGVLGASFVWQYGWIGLIGSVFLTGITAYCAWRAIMPALGMAEALEMITQKVFREALIRFPKSFDEEPDTPSVYN